MPDELTNTVFGAVQSLPAAKKATLLLETAIGLISVGQYGPDVENFLEVYLRTPGMSKEDIARAFLARGNARRAAGEKLIEKAQQDFLAVLHFDPTNRELQHRVRQRHLLNHQPASQRAPAEIWARIASHIPRYHLRTWLFLSAFHRDIASRIIFDTVDLTFGVEDQEALNRGLDLFDRAKADPVFANRVKSLRLHWAYEEGDMLDLLARIFKTALPEFKSLRDFEWIGYPEMSAEMVQTLLASHPNLSSIGLIGWHFDAIGISAFRNLEKFTLRAEDDDGNADMEEVRAVLDANQNTITRLCLAAYLERHHSWDSAFESVTVKNLTHLDLVDTHISHAVLVRIAHAGNLQSLTLHGTFEEPASAAVVFASDQVLDGVHTFLPHLTQFRFLMVDPASDVPLPKDLVLYQAVTKFLRGRAQLRRLDLGSCPWDLVRKIIPQLRGLKVLRVRIEDITAQTIEDLVKILPLQMTAIHLNFATSYVAPQRLAECFRRFSLSLSFLHLSGSRAMHARPKPNLLSEKEMDRQTDLWMKDARYVAECLVGLDFIGWHGEHYVVVRSGEGNAVEIKELPMRRRLDCGKGVDLGGGDAGWTERKDVPVGYEVSGEDED